MLAGLALAFAASLAGCRTHWQSRARGPGFPAGSSGAGASGEPVATGAEPWAVEHEEDLPPVVEEATEGAPLGDEDIDERATNGGSFAASTYAALDRTACEGELSRRRIAFERVDEARGVVAPLRLKGAIAGVDFHSMLPPAQRRTSPYEIYDCRLVLALDDWARVLTRHDVVEVVHYSVYRPPPKRMVLNGPGRRHGGALAIDAAIFKTRDGRTMSVDKDFHGRIGSKPCGPRAAPLSGLPSEAITLRALVCEAADAQLFNVVLTPDFNRPHKNHFHLEVSVGSRHVYLR